MIVDCRKTNILFHTPPGVELITGEGLSGIELGEDFWDEPWAPEENATFTEKSTAMGVADVSDCYHRCRLEGRFVIISVGLLCGPSI